MRSVSQITNFGSQIIEAHAPHKSASGQSEVSASRVGNCSLRVYSGARETLKVVLADRLCLGRRRPDAAQLRAYAKQVKAWQRFELTDVTAKVVIYEAFVEGKLEAPKHLARTGARYILRSEIRGVPPRDKLESIECLHIGI